MAFVDLEKVFDRVPHFVGAEIPWFQGYRISDRISGIWQVFIIVLEALSREFRKGLPIELLYANDLVLIVETKELLLEKVRK